MTGSGKRLLDAWFAPKRFENLALYEHLGVLFIKGYVPTGGDLVNRRYGIRVVDVRRDRETLTRFDRYTRRVEAAHEVVFLGFLAFSLWGALTGRTTPIHFLVAAIVYVLLILSPAMLQRYNRLRIYAVLRRLNRREPPSMA